ncbi:hypothetical protein GCK72_022725 [Caenorhabditis remanei]|uniref:CDP-diacylglycerol--inositol 3-phosphatidyltransferase n=1 Tax=Caenorhabditis remanei TaxID=31234 RepID=A0A6A5FUN6_CAERE|nr:hypothetical protein GCK72_022725 [Caenorhabditis remanei]KAF1746272.1 hypothetical protein GCK72_022725 [Caenorhabditis remanei]
MDSSSSNTVANNNNVWLFNPNLIGYGRIVLAIMAMYYMSSSPCCAMICYALSDAFDGWAARFGAMLDQLTDRCGTLALVMALCKFFPDHLFLLQLSAVIDIASHWLHLHATDLSGAIYDTTEGSISSSQCFCHDIARIDNGLPGFGKHKGSGWQQLMIQNCCDLCVQTDPILLFLLCAVVGGGVGTFRMILAGDSNWSNSKLSSCSDSLQVLVSFGFVGERPITAFTSDCSTNLMFPDHVNGNFLAFDSLVA